MAFSKFTLKSVKQDLGIHVIEDQHLFAGCSPRVKISDYLKTTLEEFSPLALAINTEKSRSEWIVAPVLAEVRRQCNKRISLFSGISWSVDPERGLEGFCDYLISADPEQFYLSAPVAVVVEAKKENLIGGLGQCIATLVAAAIFNAREGNQIPRLYGAVTTGSNWKFMRLEGKTAYIDIDEYSLQNIELLMGIWMQLVTPTSPEKKRVGSGEDDVLAAVDGSEDASPEILDRQTVLTRLHPHLDTLQQFRIRSLALFGSVARNEATATSDLDFLVELEAPTTFDRYMDLKFFLEDLFKRPVDLVTKRSLKPQISQAVLEEVFYVT